MENSEENIHVDIEAKRVKVDKRINFADGVSCNANVIL